jgi:hypothetical protein
MAMVIDFREAEVLVRQRPQAANRLGHLQLAVAHIRQKSA